MMTKKPVLKDKEIHPTHEVLEQALGASFRAWSELESFLAGEGTGPDWNFYRDGNAWLAKMPYGRKNLGWLIVYDGFFTVTCHFLPRHAESIRESDLTERLKVQFAHPNSPRKLMPVSITVSSGSLPEEVRTLIRFKKSIK